VLRNCFDIHSPLVCSPFLDKTTELVLSYQPLVPILEENFTVCTEAVDYPETRWQTMQLI